VRELVDYAVANCDRKDLSIWEVRNHERNFTYSKASILLVYMDVEYLVTVIQVMLWVAMDRGLRLAGELHEVLQMIITMDRLLH
jgi:hypothetical protein